ncbi:mechanosensitive ion channel family protein [Luteimonas kalidii]|uniref:Small-conductance mechanosensitive channel n=1 Tax=Luteimonas kalidii TaxID=3042025 RepID=A0ABT6JSL9_9GAMM|nr:mechanosensitive ion channel family protein [Luteimonas kalidii]MDH5833597.1 mechanosensitive ion channel family protein [Luteimonas kalidii]
MESMLGMVREGAWTTLATYWGGRILIALLVLFVGIRLAKWLAGLAERGMTRSHIEPTAVSFLRKVVYVALLVVLALTVLQAIFGVAPTSMIAVLGAAGLAIGLALKDSLSNVASGVMLVSLKPFRVGHIVTINGVTGKVEDVSIFQTRLRGADNQVIVMPNSLITTDSIINLTPDTMRRVEIVVGIGYGDDIDHARRIIEEIFAADERLLPEPAPDVMVYALGDNSVNLGVRCHVANADWFAVKCALTEQIKKRFDAEGITIPYPQRDVHMYHHAGGGVPALSSAPGDRPALPDPSGAQAG